MGTPLHHRTNFESRREVEQLEPNQLNAYQLGRLNELLDAILPTNQFYREKLSDLEHPLKSLDDLGKFPFTTKDELLGGESKAGFAANLSFPADQYSSCLLYTSPSPRDATLSRMPSSA